jgi:hypothetical protein
LRRKIITTTATIMTTEIIMMIEIPAEIIVKRTTISGRKMLSGFARTIEMRITSTEIIGLITRAVNIFPTVGVHAFNQRP